MTELHADLPSSGLEPGIDPADLATCIRVFDQLNELPIEHPDALVLRRATANLFKRIKKRRRVERRQQVRASDNAVIAATATGSPQRIDDETQGLPLISTVPGATAGSLLNPID